MKDKQCDLIRRELEELTLNEEFSVAAANHLRGCVDCREFQRQQAKLRQIIGSLDTVNAPADFDFRLRARLAADSDRSGFRYWSFAMRGLATVAVLVVFGVAAAIVWQTTRPGPGVVETAEQKASPYVAPQQAEPNPEAASTQGDRSRSNEPAFADLRHTHTFDAFPNNASRRNPGRPIALKSRGPIATLERSSLRANVQPIAQPMLETATEFSIDASLQSVKVSLDDGRGNARTISFPTVSFGSQRAVATGNQFASQGVW